MKSRYLGKPVVRSCVDCLYCRRHLLYAGKWYCQHPGVHEGVPVPHDLRCFVRRGSKQEAEK